MKVGVHTSIAGGFEKAALHAREIGCNTLQIFSANPRGWAAPANSERCDAFRSACERCALAPVVVHANYLINLAASDPVIRQKSIEAFRKELSRSRALGADYIVLHPGSAKGTTPCRAIETFVESLRCAVAGEKPGGPVVLIENTAGQGSVLGRTLEEIGEMLEGISRDLPAGVCIDTAHSFAAGYPVHTPDGLEELVRQIDSAIGLSHLRLIHANDSKSAFNSRCDRHEHIGKGEIGREAFGRIVRHPALRQVPFICETPVDSPGDDKRNIAIMRKLGSADPKKAVGGAHIPDMRHVCD